MAKNTTTTNFDNFLEKCFAGLDADTRVQLTEKYLTIGVKKVLAEKELVESIFAMLENNLNISETSRNTFVHRNTILYRVEKILKLTGLDVRKFEDAVELRLILWLNGRTK